jgi:hypothetical protein
MKSHPIFVKDRSIEENPITKPIIFLRYCTVQYSYCATLRRRRQKYRPLYLFPQWKGYTPKV